MKLTKPFLLAGVLATFSGSLGAQTLYWDTNGATPGAGNPADGTWDLDTSTNWTTDSTGSIGTSIYSAGADVIFSAGTDADTANIVLSGTQTVSSVTIKNGNVSFSGSNLDDTGSNVTFTVDSGASATMTNLGAFNGDFVINGTFTANIINAGGGMSKSGTGTMTVNRLDATLSVNQGTLIYTGSLGATGAKLKNTTVNNSGTLRLEGLSFDGSKRNLTINTGGTVEFASGVVQTVSLLSGGGHLTGEAGSALKVGGDNKAATFDGVIDGSINIYSIGTGSLTLSSTSSMTFTIGANGVNNSIFGDGVNNSATNLNGTFVFDLTGADLSEGNSWLIVDVDALNETYGETFAIASFTDAGGVWTYDSDSNLSFNEATGILTYTAIPEPTTYALMLGLVAGALMLRRRRR